NRTRDTRYVTFVIGTPNDTVEYSLDGSEWTKMNHTVTEDPNYQFNVLKFDNASELMDGRRPSAATLSTHVWQTKLPTTLKAGQYTIQVRATDMFGRTHLQTKEL